MKVVCVIPARLKSKRFPRKVLSNIGGKPLLQWIWEAAISCPQFDAVAFAIDHLDTAALIRKFRGDYFMTDENCRSGTDRLVELMESKRLKGDIWVNWQGDELFINSSMIADLLQTVDDLETDVWTLKKQITQQVDIDNSHVVKVVTDQMGYALYFSRAPIPYARDGLSVYHKHIGLYAYHQSALEKIRTLPASPLEKTESLEQLRFMEGGLKIRVHTTSIDTQGIDMPEDLLSALKKMPDFFKIAITRSSGYI